MRAAIAAAEPRQPAQRLRVHLGFRANALGELDRLERKLARYTEAMLPLN